MSAGLTQRLLFCPEVETQDMADWYRVLDLYIAPQRWEGFGLTPLEAMACGVPVIATKVGAFEQILTPQTGALIETNDTGAMAQATLKVLSDKTALAEMGHAARAHVTQNFSIEREAQALVDVYQRLLNSH